MNVKRKIGLGKGLSSLLGPPETETVEESVSFEIPVEDIYTNPYQPRTQFDPDALQDLKESIRVQGIIQPIAVRRNGDKYELISGERRLQASKMAGLKTIPAFVREATDSQMLELGLIENIQRENLNPMEIALAYKRLIDECDLKQEELGARVGKDRTTVNNYLRLLNLPSLIQEGLAAKQLSMGHARALLGIADEHKLLKAYQETVTKELSVRKVEELVKLLNGQPKAGTARKPEVMSSKKVTLGDFQDKFSQIFDKRVVVQADESHKGEIKIPFTSKLELDQIIDRLKK